MLWLVSLVLLVSHVRADDDEDLVSLVAPHHRRHISVRQGLHSYRHGIGELHRYQPSHKPPVKAVQSKPQHHRYVPVHYYIPSYRYVSPYQQAYYYTPYPYYFPIIRHTPPVPHGKPPVAGVHKISTISNNQPQTIIIKEFPEEVAGPHTDTDELELGFREPPPLEPVIPAGIVQSTAPIFSTTLFHNSKQAPIFSHINHD